MGCAFSGDVDTPKFFPLETAKRHTSHLPTGVSLLLLEQAPLSTGEPAFGNGFLKLIHKFPQFALLNRKKKNTNL